MVTLSDINEQQIVTATLESLAFTLSLIGDAVITTDGHGSIVLANSIAEHLTGWHRDETIGRNVEEIFTLIDPNTSVQQPSPVSEVLSTEKEVRLTCRKILISRDGTKRFITDSASPIFSKDGHMMGTIMIFRDETAKEQADLERARASKLDSIGILAGGIAHDFNNMLAGISLNLSLASEMLGKSPATELLKQASNAAVEARYLTQQLLTFSKGGTPQRQPLNFAPLISKAAKFALQGSSTRIQYDIEPHLPAVEGDPLQLRQVVQNIVINGMQAMSSAGRLEVTARLVKLTEKSIPLLKAGSYVEVAFTDHGPGIGREHLEKIFDPYFTTKATGTGLGLAVTYSIMRAHNGMITVESQTNVGTTFTLFLPASNKKAYDIISGPMPILGKGKGRILIMDDNEEILAAMTKGLELFGYEVTPTSGSKEAIDAFSAAEEESRCYSAVIFDLTLPGDISGVETLAYLRQVNPGVRAVLSSGYSDNEVMANYAHYGFQMKLVKPFTIQQLGQTLEKLFGMPAPDAPAGQKAWHS
jgi:two-component system cell cycle sensor histidine kinase/response regulator CckA